MIRSQLRRALGAPFSRTRVTAILATAVVGAGLALLAPPTFHWVTEYGVEREAVQAHRVTPSSITPTPTTTTVPALPTEGIAPSEPPAVDLAEVATRPERVETDRVGTRSFTTVGVRVAAETDEPVLVRWNGRNGWSDWYELEIERDLGPDHGSSEAAAATSGSPTIETEPLWVGEATAYQVNLPERSTAIDAEVLLVRATGGHLAAESEVASAGAATLNQPPIHTRGEWGARAATNDIGATDDLKMAIVHHSDTGNDYGPGDVPAVLRSIQAYHISGRGWSDIGYNVVVDKFGGMWEGREGSIDRLSIGAHSAGFNTATIGVMVLGNYSAGAPSGAAIGSVGEVIAWRFANAGVDPASTVDYTSGGSLSIPAGETRTFPRVVGHRDVGATACPGAFLYPRLNDIRGQVAVRFPAKSSPGGIVDTVVGGPNSLLVSGWALDPSASDSIPVHVYIDGIGTDLGPASNPRPDIASLFPRSGAAHGFSHVFTGLSPGPHQVCTFAINVGLGSNTLMSCRTAVVPSGSPIGYVDVARLGPEGLLTLSGWALDPDTADPIGIHVYIDGVGTDLGPTTLQRPDLGGPFPLTGTRHGFALTRQLSDAPHTVCVFAIDVGPGENALITCRQLVPPSGSPVGTLDTVIGLPDGRYHFAGWAIDPDVSAPIEVHAYVDDVGVNLGPTSVERPDLSGPFPGHGTRHGFGGGGSGLAPGNHQLCVAGINVATGANSLLACRTFTVPAGSPIGVVDAATRVSGARLRVSGWTLDPDTAAPTGVHVYIDGAGYDAGQASENRPDVGNVFAGYGAAHGFSWTSPTLSAGNHAVCVFAINAGVGANALLNCRTVTV